MAELLSDLIEGNINNVTALCCVIIMFFIMLIATRMARVLNPKG